MQENVISLGRKKYTEHFFFNRRLYQGQQYDSVFSYTMIHLKQQPLMMMKID